LDLENPQQYLQRKAILFNTENQFLFTRKLIVLFSYLPKILILRPYLFQIKPEENIDLLENNEKIMIVLP